MTKILLVSEDYIKSNSNISDNCWGKFLLPAIREAQDINLQSVLGSKLYGKILSIVADGTIKDEANKAYKDLLDNYIQSMLLYQVLSNVVPIIGTKLSNLGALTTDDEKAYNVSPAEREKLENYYKYRCDFYTKRMQEYLCDKREQFPELGNCKFMKPNTESSATTDVWLGGKRARR